jgi:N-acetylated-alpha-linked acidic dipeptidase
MKRLILLACLVAPALAEQPARGFPAGQWKLQQEHEAKFRGLVDPERIRSYMRVMSEEPHHAGSRGSMDVAQYALGLFREWGLEARIEAFEALMPYPLSRSLDLIAPVKYKAKLKEAVIKEDKDSADADQLPTYNAYSASGEATGQLVYVNYGTLEDYETLKQLGISVKGKIVIARYGKCWRGTKARLAQENGALACILYSDPRDDGYFQGDIYPRGPFRPPTGVQRGSVMDMPIYVGDPLSPGWPSERGSKRLAREEAQTILKIPVQPISYEDARPLLENLDGPVAPEPWRGALPITYHLGPGPATVRLRVEMDWSTRPLYNVIATINGSVWPNQWVLWGNHHDAWVNGAQDPVSGAAAVLETGRALAEMLKEGWKPRRTIKLALWDGEEFGLLGSTEWVEKRRAELDRKLVAYFNSDSNGRGPLRAGGSPLLQRFMEEVARDISDPVASKSVLDRWREQQRRSKDQPPPEFRLTPLGAGSDYVAFLHHAGISSVNAGFAGDPGGVYHSIYDSFEWYTKFSDQNFVYGRALAQLMGAALLRLSSAPLVGFEFTGLVSNVRAWRNDLEQTVQRSDGQLDFKEFDAALARIEKAAVAYEAAADAFLKRAELPPAAQLAAINEAIFRSERALLTSAGLPGREWYKHQLYAPGMYTGYSAKTLPAVREAVEAKQWTAAAAHMKPLVQALDAFAARVEAAVALLGGS